MTQPKKGSREDPSKVSTNKNTVHPQLIVRWYIWINKGLDKDTKEKLLDIYEPIPEFDAHKMNPEFYHEILREKAKIRDEYSVNTQKIAGAVLTTNE